MEVTLILMPFLNFKFKISNLKLARGLTLIELLVVVAILGILASVTSVLLIGHQKQARDAKRISDLAQVKRALQSAKNDCTSAAFYPQVAWSSTGGTNFTRLTTYLTNTNLKYMLTAVQDPSGASRPYIFVFNSAANGTNVCPDISGGTTQEGITDFVLKAKLEDAKNPNLKASYVKCTNTVFDNVLPLPADSNGDSIDDNFYYYECND